MLDLEKAFPKRKALNSEKYLVPSRVCPTSYDPCFGEGSLGGMLPQHLREPLHLHLSEHFNAIHRI
jgi:hypothetical protein